MKRIPDKTSPIHSKIRRFLLYWEHQGERRQRQVEQQKGSGKDKNIHSGHRQRIRDRFLKTGLDGFQDHEVLELLLFYAIPRGDTNKIAHQLLERFGSFSGVCDAPIEELQKVPGVGASASILVGRVSSLSRRYLDDKYAAGTVLDTTEKVGSFLKHKFVGRTNEVVYLACLDNKKKLLYCDILTEGTIDSAPITVRRSVEVAMRVAAASVVVAHNHPQGFALPSNDDIATTIKLRNALDAVSVQLLDHIIVAQDDFVSLADSGLFVGM